MNTIKIIILLIIIFCLYQMLTKSNEDFVSEQTQDIKAKWYKQKNNKCNPGDREYWQSSDNTTYCIPPDYCPNNKIKVYDGCCPINEPKEKYLCKNNTSYTNAESVLGEERYSYKIYSLYGICPAGYKSGNVPGGVYCKAPENKCPIDYNLVYLDINNRKDKCCPKGSKLVAGCDIN